MNQSKEKRLKILFVNDNLIGGGVEKLLNDLLPLMNKEHHCELLVLTFEGEEYKKSLLDAGIKVMAIPEEYKNHWQKIKYLQRLIEKEQYDIVHANEFPSIYYCSVVRRMRGRNDRAPKFVMTEHSTDNRRRHYKGLKGLEKWMYAGYDRVISISPETQSALLRWIGVKRTGNKYVVINNGIPLQSFERAEPYKREDVFPESSNKDIILCVVGRFSPEKNPLFMLDIMRYLPLNYRLIFVGDGELLNTVKEEAEKQELMERINFLGFRRDVGAIMKTSDIVVIPSKWEGFGLIAVEAMACKKAVVCSNVPGLAEVVGSGGIKVPVGDSRAFADGILSLEDVKLKEQFIINGYEQAKKFSIETMRDSYLELYEELVKAI